MAEKRRKEIKKETKKEDPLFFITVVQSVLCVILGAVIFFMWRGGGEAADNLKSDFNLLMSYNMAESDISKQIAAYFKTPGDFLPAFAPGKAETTSVSMEEAREMTAEEETTNASEEKATEEKAASVENSTEINESEEEVTEKNANQGGEDIAVFRAADNTSFAPVETTCAIVAPVNSNKYTSAFGYRINPITGEKSFHTGLDIAAPAGSKIVSVYNGKVRKVGEDDRSGKYIFITHSDGFESFYCHCSEILAEEGAIIRQGETIALVGSTGWSTGPHLHFEIRKNSVRLNPMWLLEENES